MLVWKSRDTWEEAGKCLSKKGRLAGQREPHAVHNRTRASHRIGGRILVGFIFRTSSQFLSTVRLSSCPRSSHPFGHPFGRSIEAQFCPAIYSESGFEACFGTYLPLGRPGR